MHLFAGMAHAGNVFVTLDRAWRRVSRLRRAPSLCVSCDLIVLCVLTTRPGAQCVERRGADDHPLKAAMLSGVTAAAAAAATHRR